MRPSTMNGLAGLPRCFDDGEGEGVGTPSRRGDGDGSHALTANDARVLADGRVER